MAKPLPNTNAPAFRKKKNSVPSSSGVGPRRPLTRNGKTVAGTAPLDDFGSTRTKTTATPESRMSQIISVPLQAVAAAVTVNIAHKNQSLRKALRDNL